MNDIDLWLKIYRQDVFIETSKYFMDIFPKELTSIILDYCTGFKDFCKNCGFSPCGACQPYGPCQPSRPHLCGYMFTYIDIHVSASLEDYKFRNCYFITRVSFYEWRDDNVESFKECACDALQLLESQRSIEYTKLFNSEGILISNDFQLRRTLYDKSRSTSCILFTSPHVAWEDLSK